MKIKKQILFLIITVLTISTFAQTINRSITNITLPSSSLQNIKLDHYLWGYAQENKIPHSKLPIDFSSIDNWQGMSDYLAVSNDGKYFAYCIESGSGHPLNLKKQDSLIVQATKGSWRRSYQGLQPVFFAADNKQYVLKDQNKLCFIELGSDQFAAVDGVKSFINDNINHQWVAYNRTANEKTVVLRNLSTGIDKEFPDIASFSFDLSGKWLACKMANNALALLIYNLETGKQQQFPTVASYIFSPSGDRLLINTGKDLQYVKGTDQSVTTIWTNSDTSIALADFAFDESGKQVIFTARAEVGDREINSVMYYGESMEQAKIEVDKKTPGLASDAQIGSPSFTDNGRYIKYWLSWRPAMQTPVDGNAQLDVWGYKDDYTKSHKGNLLKQSLLLVQVEDSRRILLTGEDENLCLLQGDYAVVKKSGKKLYGDRFWDNVSGYNSDSNWLVSLKDGRRTLLPSKQSHDYFYFSPGGLYLVWFDASRGCHYFSCDLQTGKIVNISNGIPSDRLGNVDRYVRSDKKPERPSGDRPAAWLENDGGLLVYDNNDIWQLDFVGKIPAVNLTGGYGRSHNIIFSLFNSDRSSDTKPILEVKAPLLLRAFNTINKNNGFYRTKTNASCNPELLSMAPWFMHIIDWCQDPNHSNKGIAPVKAKNEDVWIVQRQSASDAPNYYSTTDFRSFKKLTDFQPHKNYHWFSQELHSFTHLDGNKGQGILYKPENFDPHKKYPVMIVFYGGFSNNMHQYRTPSYNYDAITPGESPEWFLNNGYLVFTPDIYAYPLHYGPGAYSVIDGAAAYLKSLPYVDANGLGCATHSSSSKMGAYLFTHSKSLSAISMSEGWLYGNMTNVALSDDLGGIEGDFGNLYENKAAWIDHTTVLNADKAISPLLLFCNKKSSEEYQNQTLQFYTALRRQDKKVWWLKYDKGGHWLSDLDELKDYTIRYTQFFDHYLKKAPAPRWMTEGVPNALRGVETRFELDASGSCGLKDNCVICHAWNQQYKRNPAMFQKTISEWSLDKDIQAELDKKVAAERKKLDAEGKIETKKILDILKNGYPKEKE